MPRSTSGSGRADAELAALDKHAAAGTDRGGAGDGAQAAGRSCQGRCRCRDGRRSGPGLERRVDDRGAVRADLASAKALADGAGSAVAAEAAAAAPTDVAAMKTALKALQADRVTGRCRAVRGRGRGTAQDLSGAGRQGRQGAGQERWQGGGRTPWRRRPRRSATPRPSRSPRVSSAFTLPSVEARLTKLQALAARRPAEGADRSGGQGPDRGQGQEQGEGRDRGDGCCCVAPAMPPTRPSKADIERGKFDTEAAKATTHVATVTDAEDEEGARSGAGRCEEAGRCVQVRRSRARR